ncbi:olfactory receptor 12D3-like [Tachyglossus aculeatus]|uniref:olfactory receptor 12D3-like n=1 Tax=Tachyglossus aculeatus TaxID=9261 RepID=UPI0018F6BBDD|nr:olfactory receptor 12D3-like [Tachyglossus aculeatus]
MHNQTIVSEFFLLGLTDVQGLQTFLFALLLIVYLINVAGNSAIMMIVAAEPRLHSPMYFFLGNLSCLDICFSTVTLPKLLANLLSARKAISFLGCIAQLHFFHFLGSAEATLLAVMALDRFVAICSPLRYPVIMSRWVCILLGGATWATGFFHALLHSVLTSRLSFCGSRRVPHFFCDIKPLLALACDSIKLHLWLLNTVTGSVVLGPFFLTLLSYLYLIGFLLLQSRSWRVLSKALSTCAAHFSVVILFYVPVIVAYTSPTLGGSMVQDLVITIMYSVATPLFNPLIYTLRNRDVKEALKKVILRKLCPVRF